MEKNFQKNISYTDLSLIIGPAFSLLILTYFANVSGGSLSVVHGAFIVITISNHLFAILFGIVWKRDKAVSAQEKS